MISITNMSSLYHKFLSEYKASHQELKVLEEYLSKYDINNIMLYMITKEEVKVFICKEMMEYVETHSDKPWDWNEISCNPNITMEYVETHLDKLWNWREISWNPNLTMEYVEKHSDKPWDWS